MTFRRLAAGLGIGIAIIVVMFQIRGMLEIQSSAPETDAAAYLSAATALRDGLNPYDQPFQTELLPGERFPRLPYLYSPLLAVISVPLTYLPIEVGASEFILLAVIEAGLLCWAFSRWIGCPVA